MRRVKTPDLTAGDIVLCHGMRLELQPDPEVFQAPGAGNGTGYAWTGRILNLEETLAEGFVPPAWIKDGPWTVQGNDLAYWGVED